MFGEPSTSSSGSGSMFTIIKKEKKEKKDKKDKKDKSGADASSSTAEAQGAAVSIDPSFSIGADRIAVSDFFSANSSTQQTPSYSQKPTSFYGEVLHSPSLFDSISAAQSDFDFDGNRAPASTLPPPGKSTVDPLLAKILSSVSNTTTNSVQPTTSASSTPSQASGGGGGSKFVAAMLKANAQRQERLENANTDKLRREGKIAIDNLDGKDASGPGGLTNTNNESAAAPKIRPMVTDAYKAWVAENDRKRVMAAVKGVNNAPEEESDDEPLGTALTEINVNADDEDDTFYFRSDWHTIKKVAVAASNDRPQQTNMNETLQAPPSSSFTVVEPYGVIEASDEPRPSYPTAASSTAPILEETIPVRERIRTLRSKRQREVCNALEAFCTLPTSEGMHDPEDAVAYPIRGLGLTDFWLRCGESLLV